MPNAVSSHRLFAFNHQKGRCYYCGTRMWLANPKPFAAHNGITIPQAKRIQCTAEHLIARKDGGGNDRANIVAACRFCNQTRHRIIPAPTASNFKKRVSRRVNLQKWHPKEFVHLL